MDRTGPLQVQEAGFDLQAAVRVEAGDRGRLERLCRYLVRPPLAQERVRRLLDGRIALTLQRPWADGTTHLLFTPAEVLARLVPLIPRPRINVLLYHGELAPNAPWRPAVVARCVASDPPPSCAHPEPPPGSPPTAPEGKRARPRYRAWAELMRRAFETDVLACARCGGRMVVIATIEDPVVIRRILTHLGLSLEPGDARPSRAPPEPDEGFG